VLGLPVPEHPFAHVTVTQEQDRRFRPEIKPHVTTRKRRVIVVNGIRTTDPIATFIDCAGWLSLVDLVVLGDALVKKYRISAEELRKSCAASSDYYAGLARRAAHYVREGVDSPMETRLRMLIVLGGLPEPVVNFKLYNDDGTWRRRFDLCYPEIKLIVEYDGRHHAESPAQWESDLERREEFDDEGYRILIVTAKGIYVEPLRTLERVRRQLVLRGFEDVPPIQPGWEEHFGVTRARSA
jgi:very-short-patch-repair endonuclease